MNKHPLSQEEYDAIYARVPRLCVELMMVEPAGVVLTQRAVPPGEGLWHLPGSTVRHGELLVETARRVALDETGVQIEIVQQLGVAEYAFPGYTHRPVSVVYLARPIDRNYRCDKTATDVRVFGVPDQLAGISMIEQHRALLLEHAGIVKALARAIHDP